MKPTVSSPDVLLVQPPVAGPYHFWKAESLGMGYLASALESQGYSVDILDAFLTDLSIQTVIRRILESPPRLLLGFSLLSYELYCTGRQILDRIRAEGVKVHVTAGSWFPTFWHQTMIGDDFPLDSVVLGEGERGICALARFLSTGGWGDYEPLLDVQKVGGVLIVRQKETLLNLDELPYPRRDYLPYALEKFNLATSHTSRGCGHSGCTFCSVPRFYRGGPKHRLRSSSNVIGEVEEISRAGAGFIFFADEDFLGVPPAGPARAFKIFEGVAERGITMRYAFNCTSRGVEEGLFRKLAALGLSAVYIGLESSIDRMLKLFGKGVYFSEIEKSIGILHDLGIKLVPGWIMFERQTTLEEVESQVQFLKRADAYHVNFLKALYVMKDTPIEHIYGGELYKTFYFSKYYFQDPDVDLLVRILTEDYLPEVMPHTNAIYPVWHKMLAGEGTPKQQLVFQKVNDRIRELSLGFVLEAVGRIRSRSLNGLAKVLSDQVREWCSLGAVIETLAQQFDSRR